MPKQHRVAIYEYLFKEGVMVAKKDFNAPKHPELQTIPNLHVIKTMQSLQSKGLVRSQFAWRHYYWWVTRSDCRTAARYVWMGTTKTTDAQSISGTWKMKVLSTSATTCTCPQRLSHRHWNVPHARNQLVHVQMLHQDLAMPARPVKTVLPTDVPQELPVVPIRRAMLVLEPLMLNS